MAYAMAAMAAVQLASSYFAAQNARDTAQLNNEISEWNAEFAELDAHEAILEGETQVAQYQAVIDQTLSDQTVAFAVNNVDADYGSAAAVTKETKFIGQLNRMEIEKQAQEKALGYKQEARAFRLQGDINRIADENRASQIQAAGITSSLSTLAGADFTGYGPKRSPSSSPSLGGTARNDITGYQSLTRDF